MINLKNSLLAVAVISSLGLTACQSTPSSSTYGAPGDRPAHGWGKEGDRHFKRDPKRMEEMRKRHEALNQACVGKAGQTVSVTVGDKTFQGTCETVFQPDRDAKRKAMQ